MSKYVGTMDEKTFEQYARGPHDREQMDEKIRKRFKVPDNRYFTVTLPPSPPGMVFIDEHRSRAVTTPKISKSNQ